MNELLSRVGCEKEVKFGNRRIAKVGGVSWVGALGVVRKS